MLHLFLGKGPWFRPKSHGLGAGLPIAWQGWVMLAAHIGLMVGLVQLLQQNPLVMIIALLFAALAPLPLYRAKTEGGWRWRWGSKD